MNKENNIRSNNTYGRGSPRTQRPTNKNNNKKRKDVQTHNNVIHTSRQFIFLPFSLYTRQRALRTQQDLTTAQGMQPRPSYHRLVNNEGSNSYTLYYLMTQRGTHAPLSPLNVRRNMKEGENAGHLHVILSSFRSFSILIVLGIAKYFF